jgi:hypothetical protein
MPTGRQRRSARYSAIHREHLEKRKPMVRRTAIQKLKARSMVILRLTVRQTPTARWMDSQTPTARWRR